MNPIKMILMLTVLFQVNAFADIKCPYTVHDTFEHLKKSFPKALGATTEIELASQKRLRLEDVGFGDTDLPYLCSLTELTDLYIYNDTSANKLTGANLEVLSPLKKLTLLDLDGNQIPASALRKLKGLTSLKSLYYGYGNPGGVSGWEGLNEIPSLRVLRLSSMNLTNESLAWLPGSTLQLDVLYVSNNPAIDNRALPFVAKGPARDVRFSETSIKTPDFFESFDQTSRVQILDLALGISDEDLTIILNKLKNSNLQELILPHFQTTAVAQAVLDLKHLREISVKFSSNQGRSALELLIQNSATSIDRLVLYSGDFSVVPELVDFCKAAQMKYPEANLMVQAGFKAPAQCK